MKDYLKDYNDETLSPRPGGNGRPYWNINSLKFMYVPKLHFPSLPHYDNYKYTITDCNKIEHVFISTTAEAYLTPVWKDIPQGIVIVKVEALDLENKVVAIMGVRTFYKSEGFKGIDNYKQAKRSYHEAAKMALEYIFNQDYMQYWINHDMPDPSYDLYVYPSKMVSSIVKGMLNYGHLNKDKYDVCLKIATNATNYLIKVSNENNSIYKGIPLTYYYQFRVQYPGINNELAKERIDLLHISDSINGADALLTMYEETQDKKYFDSAIPTVNFIKNNILSCGTLYMWYSLKENKSVLENKVVPYYMVKFLRHFYNITNDASILPIIDGAVEYIRKNILETTNFEGQFEDSADSDNYSNLASPMTVECLEILLEKENMDNAYLEDMKSVARFLEDQFIIWDKPCPFKPSIRNPRIGDNDEFFYPAGLEQYQWYIPIDAAGAQIIEGLLDLYEKTNDSILLEKAIVLGNTIVNMQNDKNGMIPTQWYRKTVIEDGGDLWLNCLFYTANTLNRLGNVIKNK